MSISFKDAYLLALSNKHNSSFEGFFTEKPSNHEDIKIGISPDGFPSVLIKAKAGDEKVEDVDQLNGLEAKFEVECYEETNNEKFESVYTVISFIEEEEVLRDFFFSFFEDLFKEEKNKASKKIRTAIVNLSKLFSHRKKAHRKTLMGLWSELVVILLAEDSDLWAHKWYSQNRSTFDFEFDNTGIDVKSFGGHHREHKFQIEQLVNEATNQILILSMCVKESDRGMTVFDVLNKINLEIENYSNKQKIEKLLFSLAGKNITSSTRFDLDIAKKTLLILRGDDIPSLNPKNSPLGVSEVKFNSDCSQVNGLNFDKKNQDLIASSDLL